MKLLDLLDLMHQETVTIFNKSVDGIYEEETWYSTVIHGVGLEIGQQQNIKTTGLENADRCNLIIPLASPEKEYVAAEQYTTMTENAKKERWTLKKDDFFVVGDASGVDTKQKNLFQIVSKQYGETSVFKITTIGDLTKKCLPKWKVGGK